MALFGFFKKSSPAQQAVQLPGYHPYHDSSANYIYNLLFCDNPAFFRINKQPPYDYPFDILFSEKPEAPSLQKIIDDSGTDTRIKLLAYNRQLALGYKVNGQELMGVVVEVGLDDGLDVLASFADGTARYINQTGKVLMWETTTDTTANQLTADLFTKSRQIVRQIGPWDKPRKPFPAKGNTRITFLVSDGLYFGEGSTDLFFNDQLASPALTCATRLMQYLTKTSLQQK